MFLTCLITSFLSAPDARFRDDLRTPVGLDHYVDDLFNPVLHQGSRVPVSALMFPPACSSPVPAVLQAFSCLFTAPAQLRHAFECLSLWEVCPSELR